VRLLVVSQYFWPENFRINDLVAELNSRGHQVTVLTGLPNYPDGEVFAAFKAAPQNFRQYAGCEVVRVPLWPRGKRRVSLMLNYLSFALSASLAGWWKLRGRDFDAIFVFEPSPITVGIPAGILRRKFKAPVTLWVLDLWPETLEALRILRPGPLLRAVAALVTFVYDRCDLILAQSRAFIPQIAKRCSRPRRIEYFPSWSEAVFGAGDVSPAPDVPVREGSFDIMFAGNIGESQDFPTILDAAEALKDHPAIRWLIVGDGRMAAWVSEEVQRRSLQGRVLMLGRHPVERMPSFYRCADAMLVSLKDEPTFAMTIPGKLQSYLAAGMPVLAMLNGEGADIVELSRSGVTCPAGDAKGLAAAALKLASLSAEHLHAMGRNAAAFNLEQFERRALIDRLETWLKETKLP
jgi:colanic acid biosynthesis glycosyl transferase WcaI